jgi:hypothetical protein
MAEGREQFAIGSRYQKTESEDSSVIASSEV